MSSITNSDTKAINESETFEDLTYYVVDSISSNTFGHIQDVLIPKINSLDLDIGVDDFIKIMAFAVIHSTYEEMAYNILTQVANRFVKNYENLSFDAQPLTLLICLIASDFRKDLWNKISIDLKKGVYEQINRHIMQTQDHLDEKLEKDADFFSIPFTLETEEVPGLLPETEFWRNLFSGACAKDFLSDVITSIDEERKEGSLSGYADRVNPENPVETKLFTGMILLDAIACAREMQELGLDCNTPGIPQGKFLISFLQILHNNRGAITDEASKKDNVVQALQFAALHLRDELKYTSGITQFFNFLAGDYRDMGDDCITSIELYFNSCRMYLNTDPAFKFFTENLVEERIPAYLVNGDAKKRYLWIVLQYLDNDLYDSENIPAIEASNKNDNWDYEDEDEEEDNKDQEDDKDSKDENDSDDSDNEDEEEEKKDLGYDIDARQKKDAHHASSRVVADGTRKVYKGWKKFKNNQDRVEGQINKMVEAGKRMYTGNQVEAIINGNKWTPMQILRTALTSGAIFAFNPIAGICALVLQVALKPRVSRRKRMEFLNQLDDEIRMLDEKIDDARGDGNRQAKYALMRTKNELVNTRNKIQYNLTTSRSDVKKALNYIKGPKGD